MSDIESGIPESATPHKHVIFTDLDGIEGVLVDLNTKKYYQLNETASLVWRGIERQMNADKIASEMAASYDVSLERARASVEGLLQTLFAQKLVQRG